MRRLAGQLALTLSLLLAMAVATAPGSGAATADRTVTLTVPGSVTISTSGCPPESGSLGSALMRGGPAVVTPVDCEVAFESNAPNGAELRAHDASDSGALVHALSTAWGIADAPSTSQALTDGFAACLSSTGGGATSLVTAAQGGVCTPSDSVWFGLGNSVDTGIARTTTAGSGSARLRFGARVPLGQQPGDYSGTVTFTVVSL